jgi:hypothetical protein
MTMEVAMVRDDRRDHEEDGEQTAQKRPQRHSRSAMLHGFGGAALRVFGTYVVDDDGTPRNIIVRAYHRESAKAKWEPSDASTHKTLDEMEDEISDWKLRATSVGYKQLSRRVGTRGVFDKESFAKLVKQQPKPGSFTKGGIPEPLSVKHGGGGGRRRR